MAAYFAFERIFMLYPTTLSIHTDEYKNKAILGPIRLYGSSNRRWNMVAKNPASEVPSVGAKKNTARSCNFNRAARMYQP